ncbi:MAG: Asp23/Gls24 family envelope stress response protein [Clostridiales bacterium]|nr:Asp23/Gls24 family envelope stress response protein [Clostridiales bacterium]MBD5099988.1 Asp23/Gls24 family envelope stress response protein [Clostridiales bacterium]
MAVKTSNYYGRIIITDKAISMVAHLAAADCYGVVDLVSRKLSDSISEFFNKSPQGKGVKIVTIKNKINIELFVVLREGVNIDAVTDSIKSTVKYNVETYTGMRVDGVTVNVVGVKV